ncbi:uncharacterized protein METZ01_LOCUS111741, partial [marine metagenome]
PPIGICGESGVLIPTLQNEKQKLMRDPLS